MATAFSEGDETQTIGPAGWLGVCLVVVAAVLLIIAAPNKPPPSPGQESRPAAALPGPPVPDQEGVVRAPSPALSSVPAAYTLPALCQRSPPDTTAYATTLKTPPHVLEAHRV